MGRRTTTQFETRKTRWYLLAIFLALAVAVVGAGYLYYANGKKRVEQDMARQLSGVADLKVNQILNWRKDRVEEAAALFENPFVPSGIERWIKSRPKYGVEPEMPAWIDSLRRHHDYECAFLLDSRAIVCLAACDTKQTVGSHARELVLESVHRKRVVVSDLERGEGPDRMHLDLFVPVLIRKDRPVAVFLLRLDPHEFLYPLIQTWPVPSRTGEILLIRREGDDVVYLNEPRYRRAPSLRVPLREAGLPAAMAARGVQRVVKGADYRGIPVMAALRAVPNSPWSVVAKIDMTEVHAPVRERAWTAIIVGGIVIVAAGLSMVFLYCHQRIRFALKQSQSELETEAKLSRMRRQNELILTSAGDGIFGLDPEGNHTFVNPAAARMLGYEVEELIGKHSHSICHHSRADGSPYPEEECPVYGAYRDGTVRHAADEHFWKKDGTGFPVEYTSTPIIENGKPIGAVVTFRDITERKRIEDERFKAGKLESIGILAGGIAHDFNNILVAILGNITLARLSTKPENKASTLLLEAEKASLKAKDLTQQLLALAKGGAPVKKVVRIADTIRSEAVFTTRGSNVQCHFRIAEDLWPVDVDEGQIRQVICNLVLNAVQAMPEGGTIDVRAENVIIQAGDLLPLKPGDYVKIYVNDRGIGIREEHLSRVFDPYFTTKQKGSGLGLTICHSIIKNHYGHIGVESEIGVGTNIYFYLPANPKEVPTSEELSEGILSGKGRILLMDDDNMVREVAGRLLEHIGYEGVCAEDGAEAIDLYNKAGESGRPFDAVILDLTVPGGMGGKEAAKRLMEMDPAAKVIVSSGYSSDPAVSDFRSFGFKGAIQKPYELKELAEILHRTIQEEK